MKRLSVIILTWNEMETTERCLESLYDRLDWEQDELILVDNGSTDKTSSLIEACFPRVHYFRLPKNIGVGPGRNYGLKHAEGEYIFILDNDTRVLEDCDLGQNVSEIFAKSPNLGLFAFQLWNPDGSPQSNGRRFPVLLHPLLARLSFLQHLPWCRRYLSRHLMEDLGNHGVPSPVSVDYVLGANQVFRKEVISRVGGYDARIFYGPEDAEFCLRIRRQGLDVQLQPGPHIEHAYQRRTTGFSFLTFHHLMGFFHFFWKERSFWRIHV